MCASPICVGNPPCSGNGKCANRIFQDASGRNVAEATCNCDSRWKGDVCSTPNCEVMSNCTSRGSCEVRTVARARALSYLHVFWE
jgi:hypothetical protein